MPEKEPVDVLGEISQQLEKTNKGEAKSTKERNRILGKLVTSFNDNFASLSQSLNPSNLLNMLGTNNDNLIDMLEEKFKTPVLEISPIVETGDVINEISPIVENTNIIETPTQKPDKNEFLQESIDNKKIQEAEKTNNLLDRIVDNTGETAESKSTDSGDGMSGGIFGGIAKSLKDLGGGAARFLTGGLSKLALPLALLFGSKDFMKGMKNVEKIAGSDNTFDAIEVGVAEVLSKLTMGMLSTQTIYDGIQFIKGQLLKVFTAPFTAIGEIIKGDKPVFEIVSDMVSSMVSGLTMGMFSEESIKNGLDFLKEQFMKLITNPIVTLEKIVNEFFEFIDLPPVDITGIYDDVVFKVERYIGGIVDSIVGIKDLIFDTIMEKWNSAIDIVTGAGDFVTNLNDDITQGIDNYINDIKDTILGFKNNLFNSVKDKFKDLFSFSSDEEDIDTTQINKDNIVSSKRNNIENNTDVSPATRVYTQDLYRPVVETKKSDDGVKTNITSINNNSFMTQDRDTSTSFSNGSVAGLF